MTDTRLASGPAAAPRFAELVARWSELGRQLAEAVADGALEDVPAEGLAELGTSLLAGVDRGRAVASAVVGRVDSSGAGPGGTLVAGRYSSTSRWLEAEAGLSRAAAGTVLSVAREVRDHAPEVGEAWLAGRVRSDSVHHLTIGVSGALKTLSVPASQRDQVRRDALAILVPVAERGGPADVKRAVDRLRFVLDPDGARQAAMDAYDDQSLSITRVGSMSRFTAWLTHEAAAAALTVIDQRARRIALEERAVVHTDGCPAPASEGWCTCGAAGRAGAVSKERQSHLQAVAFGELMVEQLDNAEVGSHHRVAPHVTLTVDLDTVLAHLAAEHGHGPGLVGDLVVPGSDEPTPLPDPSVRRILCDAEITRVITAPADPSLVEDSTHDGPVDGDRAGRTGEHPFARARGAAPQCPHEAAARQLRAESREVLWVGRAERTVPPRLRRLLEARDRHCAFPDCRASVRRCHAHHVQHWEDGGSTDPENTVLLCVRHHHAVHEGGWTLRRRHGVPATTSGAWAFDPPPRPRAPR